VKLWFNYDTRGEWEKGQGGEVVRERMILINSHNIFRELYGKRMTNCPRSKLRATSLVLSAV
jgi:hypothetical protein